MTSVNLVGQGEHCNCSPGAYHDGMPPVPPPRHDRKTLRTLVLLGLLVLAALGAWAMVRSGGELSSNGAELIAELRRLRLETWWPHEPFEQWWLRTTEGKVSGFSVEFRRLLPDGRYQGGQLAVQIDRGIEQMYISQWTLTADAGQGLYTGQSRLSTPDGRGGDIQAEIRMTPKAIEVVQLIGGARLTSSDARPANYIPEGTMDLLASLVAQRQHSARLLFISDSRPPRGNRPDYITYTVTFLQARSDGTRTVEVSFDGRASELITFDASGQPIRRRGEDWQERRLSAEEVARHFPQARQLLEEHRLAEPALP